jgi:hypothetical protein
MRGAEILTRSPAWQAVLRVCNTQGQHAASAENAEQTSDVGPR